MIRHYLKVSLRRLWTDKVFSAIHILGFSFALSVCLAISLFIAQEYSFDTYHEHADRIVRLVDSKNNSSEIDFRVKESLLNAFPEIESACPVNFVSDASISTGTKGYYLDHVVSTDNDFFEVFSVNFISGNSINPFETTHSAVITESTASRLFGSQDPVGKTLQFSGVLVTISAVIMDLPETSSIPGDLFLNVKNENFRFSLTIQNKDNHRWPVNIYLTLNEGIDRIAFVDNLNSNIGHLKPYINGVNEEDLTNSGLTILPLKDIHLFDKTEESFTLKGNYKLLKLLGAIAIIILVLAMINYVNLTFSRQIKRVKDSGVKKTIGASKSHIVVQFLTESVIITLFSTVAALLFVMAMIPFYQSAFNTNLEIGTFSQLRYLPIIIGLALLLGIAIGWLPAFFISKTKPHKALTNTWISGKRSLLGNGLTIFQFTISIVLICCVLVIYKQIEYVKHQELGFSKDQLVKLDIPPIKYDDRRDFFAFIQEIDKSPFIENHSLSNGVPGHVNIHMGMDVQGKEKIIPCFYVDSLFIETFKLKLIEGRLPMAGDIGKTCIINESAFKEFGYKNLEDKQFRNGRPGGFEIIGVVNDFHFSSLHEKLGPACLMFKGDFMPSDINVRLSGGSIPEGMDHLRNVWAKTMEGYPINYKFYDDWFDSMYEEEERFASSITLFALLAIMISCIGILGLAISTAERRIKEIGIRKVNGAKVKEILALLTNNLLNGLHLLSSSEVP